MSNSPSGTTERPRPGALACALSCALAGLFAGVLSNGIGVAYMELSRGGGGNAWMPVGFGISFTLGAAAAWILRDWRTGHVAMKAGGAGIALITFPFAVWEYIRSLQVSGWSGLGHAVASMALLVAFGAGLCLLFSGLLASYRARGREGYSTTT